MILVKWRYDYDGYYYSDQSEEIDIPKCLRTTSEDGEDIDIVLRAEDGRLHIHMRPYSDKERYALPHVYLTSPEPFRTDDLLNMVVDYTTEKAQNYLVPSPKNNKRTTDTPRGDTRHKSVRQRTRLQPQANERQYQQITQSSRRHTDGENILPA